ncbi:uncharacterized protein LOC129290397 isoform X2 [Prosopis cineraria]|uniref:uncharacterized protein LOC129290397 isoform X2 n=1 Tax=Prosopis cineraria TaxID=364024 RepID=UPI00240F36A4|nr:uncharacterized protein LOC129290397 isoform X2 [Prosopis cineraria]
MSTRSVGGHALRSYRRRKAVLDLDLNRAPPGENREQEGPSIPPEPQLVQAVQQPQVVQPIDVEAIDDDVIECTARAFAEAKNNSRRNRGRTIVDVDFDQSHIAENAPNYCGRDSSSQTILNTDQYINLEGSGSSETGFKENQEWRKPNNTLEGFKLQCSLHCDLSGSCIGICPICCSASGVVL